MALAINTSRIQNVYPVNGGKAPASGTALNLTSSTAGWSGGASGTVSLVADSIAEANVIRFERTGGNPTATKTLPAVDFSRSCGFSFWVKWDKTVAGQADAHLIVYVSSGANINNSWACDTIRLSPGWNYIYIPMPLLPQDASANFTVGTGWANKASVGLIGFRIMANTTNGISVSFHDFQLHKRTKLIICNTTDDGLLTTKAAIDAGRLSGSKWTHFVPKAWIVGGNGGQCYNVAACTALMAAGDQISNHSTNHPNMSVSPNDTYAAALAEYGECQTWLAANGFDPFFTAAPFGIGSGSGSQGADLANEANIRQAWSDLGIKMNRGTTSRGATLISPMVNTTNRYQIQSFYPDLNTTVAQVQAAFRVAEMHGGLFFTTVHGIVDSAPSGVQCLTSVYREIERQTYLLRSAEVADVMTVSDAFNACWVG